MRALRVHAEVGPTGLRFETIPKPSQLKADEVLIRIAASGLAFPDLLMTQGKYQFKPPLPFSPGGEIAGTVEARGSAVANVQVGDRIMALIAVGGFAEYVVAVSSKCIKIPSKMSMITAAAFPMNYGTTIHALRDRGAVKPGEWVLILGAAGGVGTAAIEITKALGGRVIAVCSTQEKAEMCRKFGADVVVVGYENLKTRLAEITENHGVDVCYDAVGGAISEVALRSMAWRGRFLVIGFASGTIPKVPLNLALLKGCSIVGVFWGSYAMREQKSYEEDFELLGKWVEEGKLQPQKAVERTWPLQQAGDALTALAERRVVGKAVIVVNPADCGVVGEGKL